MCAEMKSSYIKARKTSQMKSKWEETRLNDLLYRCTAGNQSTYTMTNETNQ